MPSKRQRRTRNRRAEVAPSTMAFFRDDPAAHSYLYFLTAAEVAMQWAEVRDEIIEEWVIAHPGSRPRTWWAQDAPSPRRRIGGIGQAAYEVTAHAEVYDHGLPAVWVMPGDGFDGVPVDLDDPPVFESEAGYLRRFGLLLAGELERLAEGAFAPVAIEVEDEAA